MTYDTEIRPLSTHLPFHLPSPPLPHPSLRPPLPSYVYSQAGFNVDVAPADAQITTAEVIDTPDTMDAQVSE